MRWILAGLAVATTSCGPAPRAPEDGTTTTSEGSTQSREVSTGDAPTLDGATSIADGDGDLSSTAGSTHGTDTEDGFGGWGVPELVAVLETRGAPGLYPETLLAAGSFIFASTSQGLTTWRLDPQTLEIETAAVAGTFLAATDSSLYLAASKGFSPCCVRLSLESLESSLVSGSGQLVGGHADGIAMFRVADTPRPRTGVLSFLDDGSESDVDVFASPDLGRVFGVSSTSVIVQLGTDLAAIELGSWTASTLVDRAGSLDTVSWSEVSDDFVYLATDSHLRIIALDGTLDATLDLPVSGPEADLARLVWVDGRDATRVWASAPDGSAVEPVVEAKLPISQLALGSDALYWLSTMGRLYRLAYPR